MLKQGSNFVQHKKTDTVSLIIQHSKLLRKHNNKNDTKFKKKEKIWLYQK